MNASNYAVCFYRNGALVHEAERPGRTAAELLGLEGLREGCEVTIYTPNGRALKDWSRRVAC